MIKVSKLKELLSNIPDDAEVWAYEGEDTGIAITPARTPGVVWDCMAKWWIRATCDKKEDDYTKGF